MKTREQVIEELQLEIDRDPEGSKVPICASGDRSWSPIDVLTEIKNDTQEGREYLKAYLELDALATSRKSSASE